MSFAGQLRCCKSELELRLEVAETDEARFAIAALHGFESSVAVMFQARETGRGHEQFLASCGYVTIAAEYLRSSKLKESIWNSWPQRKVPLGQYHFSAMVPSALGLAMQFTEGMFAEVALARLTAYPNQNIDVKELAELGGWRETFWLQLKTNRPELSEWPLWSLHQWRDEAVAQLRSEYEEFANIQASHAARNRVAANGEFIAEKIAEIDALDVPELLRKASRLVMNFFHRWRRMPTETERMEFNGTVGLSLALPHFKNEFEPLMRCLWRCQKLAIHRNTACVALDELVAMLRHYEVAEAMQKRFGAIADLDRLRLTESDGDIVYPLLDESKRSISYGGETIDDLGDRMIRFLNKMCEEVRKGADVVSLDVLKSAEVCTTGGAKGQIFKINRSGWPDGVLHKASVLVDKVGKSGFRFIEADAVKSAVQEWENKFRAKQSS